MGLCATFALLIFSAYSVEAVTTIIWEQSSQEEFSKGKPKDVSISSKNEIALSRELIPVEGDMSELRIWCLTRDSQGNMYAGTGENGKVFKISKDGEISLLFDSPETDIFCLIVDDDDNIYAGTSPDGIIYKIEPDQSVPDTFFSTGEKYVWSMAFDKAGNLYAATGMTGKLYKVSPDGEGKVVYDSNDMHIKSLLSSGDYIYAGTEGSGIIYRISSDDKVFVLYDTSEREITCMAVDAHGNLYVSAASGEAVPGRDESDMSGPSGLKSDKTKRRSKVYQITPDDVITQIWSSPDPLIFSMIIDGDNLMVGTGDDGKIYSVTPDGDWTSVADSEESQILSLYNVSDTGEIWFSTGNAGKLFKLSSDYLKEGTLESEKRDASVTSKWGNIAWDAVQPDDTGVTLSTRSGNTEKPDDTWSEWSDEYTNPAGEEITSPAARFIQWRAKLTSTDGTATPILKRVSVAYLERNLKPSVESVSIGSEQKRNEGTPSRSSSSGSGKERPQKSEQVPLSGKKAIKWKATDPNSDSLEYTVYFRGVEEQSWKLLEEELRGTSHPLNTESFPDGAYLIRVVATDSPSNPLNMALSDEEISDPFDIDNTPPKVMELQAKPAVEGRYVVTGKVEDAASYIKRIQYSIDGGDWKPMFSSDQIFDSREEYFSFSTEALTEGEHTIAVKANDAAGNVSTSRTIIPAQ